MENKYYTPNISEFHVGFEYWVEGELRPRLYRGIEFPQDERKNLVITSDVKVKYLDKEDIESLGFVLDKAPEASFDNEYWIKTNKNGLIIGSWLPDADAAEPNIELMNTIFSIKNKSELKVLLKQLGIDE